MNPTKQTLADGGWLEVAPGHYIKKPQTAAQVNAPQIGQVDLPSPAKLPPATLLPSTPSLSPGALSHHGTTGREAVSTSKRIRQGEPKVRPWEKEWQEHLQSSGDWALVKAQSIRVRLANGAWYKGDVSAVPFNKPSKLHIWEVKGGKKMKGVAKGILAIKVAASTYPEIRWILVWKENGRWQQQEVLP